MPARLGSLLQVGARLPGDVTTPRLYSAGPAVQVRYSSFHAYRLKETEHFLSSYTP